LDDEAAYGVPWDSDEDFWSDSEEETGPDWNERTRMQIAEAMPHDDDFWNCVICGNQVLGCTFVSYPEAKDEDPPRPAVRVHVFACALEHRNKYNMVWDWETEPGVPKEGYNNDGTKIGSDEDSNPATRLKTDKKRLPF